MKATKPAGEEQCNADGLATDPDVALELNEPTAKAEEVGSDSCPEVSNKTPGILYLDI